MNVNRRTNVASNFLSHGLLNVFYKSFQWQILENTKRDITKIKILWKPLPKFIILANIALWDVSATILWGKKALESIVCLSSRIPGVPWQRQTRGKVRLNFRYRTFQSSTNTKGAKPNCKSHDGFYTYSTQNKWLNLVNLGWLNLWPPTLIKWPRHQDRIINWH